MTNYSDEIYRSPKALSYLTIGGLSMVGLSEFLSLILGFGQVLSPASVINGNQPVWVVFQGLVAMVEFPCFIFTVVVFLTWLNRAYKNLIPLRAHHLEFSSGWAVGWWFVPFANLVKPFQVVREVWNESDPDIDPNMSFLSTSGGAPALLGFWWAFWIISRIASNLTSRMFNDVVEQMNKATFKDLEFIGYFFIVSGILTVIAAFLAIKVVSGITQRQEQRILKVGALPQDFQQPPAPPVFN
jgi:hypothetical protein